MQLFVSISHLSALCHGFDGQRRWGRCRPGVFGREVCGGLLCWVGLGEQGHTSSSHSPGPRAAVRVERFGASSWCALLSALLCHSNG